MRRSWYRTLSSVPLHWEETRIMLNFGAVDWQCQVYVNERELGVHTGGIDKVSDLQEACSALILRGLRHAEMILKMFEVVRFLILHIGYLRVE